MATGKCSATCKLL